MVLSDTPIHHISGSGWPANMLTSDDRTRFNRYRHAADFANGSQWPDRARRGEQRLTFNYARSLVRKAASYVFPMPVTFSVAPDSDDPSVMAVATIAEKWLNSMTSRLGLAHLDLAMATEIAILGDGINKVTWDARSGHPRVTSVDPSTVSVQCDADDPRRLGGVLVRHGPLP